MLSAAEAEKQVQETVAPLPAEDCPLTRAHGRVLRQPLVADRELPPFDRVAMDGFALRYDAWLAGTRSFRVAGVQAAGTLPLSLPANDACIEVMTGAVLPGGTDTVVPYEDTTRGHEGMTIAAGVNIAPSQAVHRRGTDHAAGSVVVPAGVRLTGREIAVAAACGYAHLAVTLQPEVAVVATGDELVEVSSPVAPHQVRRSNDYALRAALIAGGHPRVERYHLHDMRHEIEHLLWHIVAQYDVVLLTGGVSKGKFDFLPQVLDELGVEKLFQGVRQQPGKPFWFGRSPRHTPVFALPGNPASAYICLHRYVLPALAKMSGAAPPAQRYAVLAQPIALKPRLTVFLPARITSGPRGEQQAAPVQLNTSGDFTGLLATEGFIELPEGTEALAPDTPVRFWAWV